MTIIQSLILGAIEGITEFLPISSTAHLIVAQKLLGLGSVNEFFTTVVQLGAITGLMWTEKNRLAEMLLETLKSLRQPFKGLPKTVAFKLLLATIPVLIVGFVIKDYLQFVQNSIPLIAFMSIVIGGVLFVAENYAKHHASRSQSTISHSQLFIMGLFQVLSLIPGTSRSGITATGGAFQKMSLPQALEWSFLLSIPALLAAGGYELLKAAKEGVDSSIFLPTAIGTLVAFVTAVVAINWLRKFVREKGFTPFVVYRVVFGIAILLLL
jgi:undecaprenyl-diphosphatase